VHKNGSKAGEEVIVDLGWRQGYMMSLWLFNIFIDGVMREVKAGVMERVVALMSDSGGEWKVKQILYADDRALIEDTEFKLQKLVSEFGRVSERSKLSVNVEKNKVMRVTRRENVDDIGITLDGIRMEEVDCFRYLGVDIGRDGGIKSDMKHRETEGEKVSCVLRKMWKGEGLSRDAKRGHRSADVAVL
jgi:hypothetical protein